MKEGKRAARMLLAWLMLAFAVFAVPAQAEGKGLFDWGGIAGDILWKILTTDTQTLEEREQDMLRQLGKSTLLMDSSILDVMEVLSMDPKLLNSRRLIYENLKKDSTNIDFIQASLKEPVPTEEMRRAADAILADGDAEKLKAVSLGIKSAKNKRTMAGRCNLLAAKDAAFILQHLAKGALARADSAVLLRIMNTAEQTSDLLNKQNQQSKALGDALAEYERAQNIQAPTEKEADKEMEGWHPE